MFVLPIVLLDVKRELRKQKLFRGLNVQRMQRDIAELER